jgi:hypothetical protein
MRLAGTFFIGFLLLSGLSVSTAATPEKVIQNVLQQQVEAWNRLVGSTISETTREQVLAHYQQKYPSPGARGRLAFSGLAVHRLDARIATVTGHWHLDREAAFGGAVGGVFSFVFELIDGSWRIALDHTS